MPTTNTLPPSATVLPRRQCRHCGTPFAPRHKDEHFCCSGCEAVSTMIETQGLGHFYDLRQGISAPVGERGLEPRNFDWLQTLATQAEMDARTDGITTDSTGVPDISRGEAHTALLALPLSGIHCAGCRWLINQLFARQPAAASCALDADGHFIRFGWHLPANADSPRFDVLAFANLLLTFGYALENPALPRNSERHKSGGAQVNASRRKRLFPRLLLCGVFALNAIIFSLPLRLGASIADFPFLRLFGLLVLLCATLATGLAASYFWQALPPDTNFPPRRSPLHRFPPRRFLALALILLCLLSFTASSLALPALFAADTAAAVSFASLLIAFALKR